MKRKCNRPEKKYQLNEEIQRLKTNDKLTKKLRRNRHQIKAEIKAPIINRAALVSLKEEKINFIRKLKPEKQRKLKASGESKKINQPFEQNEGSFYRELRSKLDQQKETSSPLYKCKEINDGNQLVWFTRTAFEKFWIPVWESLPSENLNAPWIYEAERAMEDVLPAQSSELVLIRSSDVQENIKKKKNWKGTGKDRVTTFWIKKFTCLHDKIGKAISVMINENIQCPEWLPGGRTVMIQESNSSIRI